MLSLVVVPGPVTYPLGPPAARCWTTPPDARWTKPPPENPKAALTLPQARPTRFAKKFVVWLCGTDRTALLALLALDHMPPLSPPKPVWWYPGTDLMSPRAPPDAPDTPPWSPPKPVW